MIQSLDFDESEFDNKIKMDDFLNTEDDPKNGYILEVGLNYPVRIK